MKHLFMSFLTFGALPLSVYLSIFQFHLRLLPNAGDHDLLYSSQLKYSLNGNTFEPSQPSKNNLFSNKQI
jgi:dolichyl-phosphate-mannose--protein O-mannosyl transferase